MASEMDKDDWEYGMDVLRAQFENEHPFGTAEIDGHRVLVAETPEQRIRGMVGRRFVGFDAMLFCLKDGGPTQFHNQGVEVDLMLGFYDAEGCLNRVAEMKAGAEPTSPYSAYYVLEVAAEQFVPDLWPPVQLDLNHASFQAQAMKQSAEAVNLRPAEMGDPVRCSNCDFYLGGGACEIVVRAGNDLVCDEFTPDDDAQKEYPEMVGR